MGFFSDLLSNNDSGTEFIPPFMPPALIGQINSGIIPVVKTDKIMLSNGEACHFAERAILVTEKTTKHYNGRHNGFSFRVAKGVTYRTGQSRGTPVEEKSTVKTKGVFYITDKRLIFVADENGFEKKLSSLTAITPYSNAVKMQFGNKTFTLMVPDGEPINTLIGLINGSC